MPGDIEQDGEHVSHEPQAGRQPGQSENGSHGIPSGSGLGKYRILERIRSTYNSTVYKARDTLLDRLVAIKQMTPALIDNPMACGDFRREAQMDGTLQRRCPPRHHHSRADRGAAGPFHHSRIR